MSEVARLSVWCFMGFIMGTFFGLEIVPKFLAIAPESIEYITDDMEIFYVNGNKEIIHDVAQVEVGENFVIMLDRESNIKAIIPNREIECIKSIRKDIE